MNEFQKIAPLTSEQQRRSRNWQVNHLRQRDIPVVHVDLIDEDMDIHEVSVPV
jgi:hypothetical protein